MISVFEVVVDPDMTAPRSYTILRSTGKFVLGGFESTTTPISMFGPVQQASNKEIQMLPEADRVQSARSFWSTQPIYVTRGYAPVPGIQGESPTGSGVSYTLSQAPPGGVANVYVDGLLLQPNGFDYVLSGTSLTFVFPITGVLYVNWQITAYVAADASDIIQYENDQYRVMSVYRDPGGGYWKAVGTRLTAS